MNNHRYPTADEIGAEALEALRSIPRKTPDEHFTELVRSGVINSKGQVTRLIGGSGEPEPDYENWTPPDVEKDGEARE